MDCYQLQTLTSFAVGQSSVKADDYLAKLKKYGYQGGGIADPFGLAAFPTFGKLVEKDPQFIPFYGMLITLIEKDISYQGELVALTEEGYRNLVRIVNLHKNPLELTDLSYDSQGLAFIIKTEDPRFKEAAFLEESKGLFYQLSKIFQDFYFGVEIYTKEENQSIGVTRSFIANHSYKPLAFPKVIYLDREDSFKAYRMLKAIADKEIITEADILQSGPYFLLTAHVMEQVYLPEEIENQSELAKKIHFSFLKKRGAIAQSGASDPDLTLKEMAESGLREKLGGTIPPEYQSRLDYELSVISKMGFSDYFLIVEDYVNFAKRSKIRVGPGRGSGAGALVSYALNITEVDPVKYGLYFERFLNPLRVTMPDIDMDFQDDKVDAVIKYLQQKYGPDKVSRIITYSTLQLRASIKQIGTIFNIPSARTDSLSKMINVRNKSESFQKEANVNYRFKKLLADPYYKDITDKAELILSYPQTTSKHASGVLVSSQPLGESMPVQEDSDNQTLIAGYEYDYLEEMGYLKFDILALKNLTFLAQVENNIVSQGQKLPDIWHSLSDKKSFDVLNRLQLVDIFQLESGGIQQAIKTLRPTSYEDIAALLALYRPGPMDSIQIYAQRKNQKVPYTLASPVLQEILKDTYGVIIYQEQIIEIAKRVAGFDGGRADLLRRAIAKKDQAKMDAMKKDFMAGAVKQGMKEAEAEAVFDLIAKFADYGFNKSHAFAYAFVTYELLYYKANYPWAFYLASFASRSLSDDDTRKIVSEIYSFSYSLKGPSINKSQVDVSFKDFNFIAGFGQIKGMQGGKSAEQIVKERERGGPYKSLGDFFQRVDLSSYTDRELNGLVQAGCFDEFGYSRQSIISSLPTLKFVFKFASSGDGDASLPAMEKIPEIKNKEDFLSEYDALGIVLSMKLSDLIVGPQKNMFLFLVADDPQPIAGGRVRILLMDEYSKEPFYLEKDPHLNKYDIISVNIDSSGGYTDITAIAKEAEK
jgi:DNA polymerase-3 subunit alpha